MLAFSENYRQAGLSRYIYEIVARVPALRKDARFTAFLASGKIPEVFSKSLPRNLKLAQSKLPTGRAPVRIAWEQTALPVEVVRKRLDLLHCTVNVRPVLCSCPAIVTVHDVVFLRYPQAFKPAKRRYLAAMTGWSCRHAAHVIAVSEQTRQDVIEFFGVAPDRVTTVHNGVGEQFSRYPKNEVEDFRRSKGLADKRIILYVGTLEPRKNIPMAIGALAHLIKSGQHEDCVLAVGGSKGWYYEEIFASAKRLGLVESGKVRFLGRIPDEELPLWYNSAAAFVYPSLYEGFGLPVLEAMGCGAPVVAADTSAFPEVVGEAGLLVDPRDQAAWCRALSSVLDDKDLAAELSTRGVEQASKFSWQKAAEETARLYDRVLGRNGK